MKALEDTPALFAQVRARFAHVDSCPLTGPRIFFENAGGALTLNSVVETSAFHAAIPDNQGRANGAAEALQTIIDTARADVAALFNAPGGRVMMGESGTELLFRLIRTAVVGTRGPVLGSSVEHPASRSAARHWAGTMGREYVEVPHDPATGLVTAEAYAAAVRPEVGVATILHTSPVSGMGNDIAAISRAIRAVAPEAFIVVDGIQHACHGGIDLTEARVDGYVISPYKVFSRHGYGIAWASDRLSALPHERLAGSAPESWDLGTRDTGAFAAMSDVVGYFDWLGGEVAPGAADRRARIEAAGAAIHAQEAALTDAAIFGTGNLKGLAELPGLHILGGAENPAREGLVSFWSDRIAAADIVERLNAEGIRTHTGKADHYSGNILEPLGLEGCVRVSFCHYNSRAEVARLLSVMADLTG